MMKCRHCSAPLSQAILDLGHAPPSNSYLTPDALRAPETTYPLRLYVCSECWLVQTEDYATADNFFSPEYAYFSSTSKSWLNHAARYVEAITERLGLGLDSMVIEVASNDGYLLRNFVAANIPCLGIEPTEGTANAAELVGVPVLREFFGEAVGRRLAAEGRSADLVCGNNVYAHVPDINDFTRGLAAVLKPEGVVTLEFPHLLRLVEENQFDTVYHEHFSYLSLTVVQRIFSANGLRLFDVEELLTHGKSLRIYGCRSDAAYVEAPGLSRVLDEEAAAGINTLVFYESFQARANEVKNRLLEFLLQARRESKEVLAYGAAAKGNTLLNYAGVRPDLLSAVFDAAPSKQNRFMPGSHIPILPPEDLVSRQPDYVLILPWNIADEVMAQLAPLADQGTKFVTAVPELKVQ